MSADQRIVELKLELPPPPKAVGVYLPALNVGNLCYTSGHLPIRSDGSLVTGCVGRDVDEQAGYQAARQCGLTLLSTLQQHLGSLDRIQRVVKLVGMVNSTAEFTGHPGVLNGCSDLMRDVFGERGIGTRSAVGMVGLPLGVTVEIEGIFEFA